MQQRDPFIIALCGRAGSGKDTAADHLVRTYGFVRAAFADAIKDMLEAHFVARSIDYAYLYEPHLKERVIPGIGVSARELMQRQGDAFRAAEPDYWVRALRDTLALHDDERRAPVHDRIVITDVRYPNEHFWVTAQGAHIVRLVRDSAVPVRQHSSEQFIDTMPCNTHLVNNGTSTAVLATLLDGLMHSLGVDERDPVGQP